MRFPVTHRSARRRDLLAAALAVLATAAGCSQKVTSVSSDYTVPEGVPSADAQLIVYAERPVVREFMTDVSPPGPSPTDTRDSLSVVWRFAPTVVNGQIVDGTRATDYQVFRREDSGGVRRILDFAVRPSARWVDSQWELYTFRDDDPARPVPATYFGRGLLSGVATPASPLTNAGSGTTDTSLADIGLRIVHGAPPNEPYTDSLFTLEWNAIPGAAAYYLHVFQYRNDLRDEMERVHSGVPAPFFAGKSKDLYAAILPPSVTRHRLGEANGRILTRRPTFYGQVYYARVSAVDGEGRMIAFPVDGDLRAGAYDNGYTLQPVGGIAVETTRVPPESGPLFALPGRLEPRRARLIDRHGVRILHLER